MTSERESAARDRPLNTLGSLSLSQTRLLEQYGIRTVRDLRASSAEAVCGALQLSSEDAERLSCALRDATQCLDRDAQSEVLLGKTAAALHVAERRRKPVISFIREFDRLLGGGLASSAITELCGVPGAGKTQVAMQIAVNSTIPALFGGVEGEAIVLDTEGNFMPERVAQMAEALHLHVRNIARKSASEEKQRALDTFQVEDILRKIHVIRCYDTLEQAAAIKALPRLIQRRNDQVRAVIIDSMAFHFRHNSMAVSKAIQRSTRSDADKENSGPDLRGSGLKSDTFGAKFADQAHRSRVLASLTAELNQTAQRYGLAVVLINQMTTRMSDGVRDSSVATDSTSSNLVPALGAAWAHAATHRVLLRFRSDGTREAMLFKSASKKSGVASFRVCAQGVRDGHEYVPSSHRKEAKKRESEDACQDGGDPAKRFKEGERQMLSPQA